VSFKLTANGRTHAAAARFSLCVEPLGGGWRECIVLGFFYF